MLRLDTVIKPWKEAASLNDHINLYGFWHETTFLTKSGDLGMVLQVPGVDYESLDRGEQEYAVKRLEAALKSFGPGFHIYQYLFKQNRPEIPFASYDDPVVEAAIDQRRRFFEAKRDHLYQIEIFYCVLLEGARSKTGVGAAFARLFRDPAGAVGELRAQFTNNYMKTLLRSQIEHDLSRLEQRVQGFIWQLADFMQIVIDELASLQRLPQLHTAITENRKSQNPVILGFQGRSQMEARYGDDAEAMLSQPATKIFLRTTEPRAAKWVSEAIGEIEIERLRETHYEGSRAGRNFALDRQTEPLVMPSEISGLDDLRGFLKYGNHVARFSFPFIALEERHPGFDERKMDDLIVPSTPPPPQPEPEPGHALIPELAGREAALDFNEGVE